ncbi:cell wall anchor domain-containing protein [Listeria floridensis FSL S10-1187]|uniref:Cell wall anchor domain-containing protein n=1 Tax=Listeria floridensis FSL S10-1187 TaxID=1265817 RepID=A0ABP3AX24_9LIST|nr:immunoglobulin-like domain-containing protein [Listeria floridensis]EUJ30955.1 cell wall anchor domain-containing protein [Listeria floridensis FSL S10-1187]
MSKKKNGAKLVKTLVAASVLTTAAFNPIMVQAVEAQNNASIQAGAYNQSASYKEEMAKLEKWAKTPEQKEMVKQVKEATKSTKAVPQERASYDTSITSITSTAKPDRDTTEFSLKFTPNANAKNAYDGVASGHINIPLSGRLKGSNLIIPNGPEFISDYENGNIGLRVNFTLPEGTSAKELVKTIDWQKSNEGMEGYYNIRWLGIPLPFFHCRIGATWDKETIQYGTKSNEFSMALRSIRKSEVSTAEWNKYDPLSTYAALTAAGLLHSGTGEGEVNGNLYFDYSKYKGNTDDTSKNKELTSGKLSPAKNGDFKIKAHFIDRSGLIAGSEGKKNLSKAIIEPGKEHINPYDSQHIASWDSYISPWDTEREYNVNSYDTPEIPGVGTVLPGESIFDRDLTIKPGDNFNDFSDKRFNRVINYFDKTDVTNGHIGDIDEVKVNHSPNRVPENATTPVKYTGTVEYSNGAVRELLPATVNVTNNTKPATEGTITPDTFTIGDSNITGKYTGDVKRLRLYINGVSVAWGGDLKDGKFIFYAANQKITTNDKVTMNAYDKDDNLLQENVPVNLKEASAAGSIDPAMYTPGDTNITGTYKGDVVKAKLFVNGNYISAGGDFSNGVFTYYAGGKIKAGDKAYLVAMDKTGKELDRKDIKISVSATSGSISPAAYNVGENTIRGSYTGNVAKMRLLVNGKSISWGGTLSNGSFSYYVKPGTIKAGDNVTLEAYDQNDKKLDSKRVQVNGQAISGTIDSATYKIGETTIKGTFSGDITVAKVYINGIAQAWGGDFGGGGFSYYVGKNKIKAGDNVTIEGYSKDTKLLDTKKVTILN